MLTIVLWLNTHEQNYKHLANPKINHDLKLYLKYNTNERQIAKSCRGAYAHEALTFSKLDNPVTYVIAKCR